MEKITSKKKVVIFTLLCVSVYFCSYLIRINLAAILVEFVSKGIATKTQLSLVTTTSFITYGVGQLLSGYISDRVSPRMLILLGYVVSIAMNVLIPVFSYSVVAMAIVWGINGLAHAFMWPPLLKIMMSALEPDTFSKSATFIGVGSGLATMLVYLVSPMIINAFDWRFVFYIFAAVVAVFAVVWIVVSGKMLKNITIVSAIKRKSSVQTSAEKEDSLVVTITKLLPFIFITIALYGMLRDGITTWMPSFVAAQFNLDNSSSIMTAAVLPVFHIISSLITYKILEWFKFKTFNAIVFYTVIAAVMIGFMSLAGSASILLTIILIALGMGSIYGVNNLQTANIPKYFAGSKNAATIAGALNFSTYIGSAISTYLFAKVSDACGWDVTVWMWFGFAVVGVIISLFVSARVNRKIK